VQAKRAGECEGKVGMAERDQLRVGPAQTRKSKLQRAARAEVRGDV